MNPERRYREIDLQPKRESTFEQDGVDSMDLIEMLEYSKRDGSFSSSSSGGGQGPLGRRDSAAQIQRVEKGTERPRS